MLFPRCLPILDLSGHMTCYDRSSAYCVAFIISTSLTVIFSCHPIKYIWLSWTGEAQGRCIDANVFWWAHSAINIATDLWILALPIPQLLKLQMSLQEKFYLLIMFSTGVL